MTPSRPYFVRAVYEWLIDNEQTPFLLVDATRPSVEVSAAFVKEGRIVLNVAPGAVRDFFIRNGEVTFSATMLRGMITTSSSIDGKTVEFKSALIGHRLGDC